MSRRADIDAVFRGGKRLQGRRIALLWLDRADGGSRCAVLAPGRLGGAVKRNRARRRLRESLRQRPHPAAAGKDLIVLCRRPIDDEFLREAGRELRGLLDRLAANGRK